MLPINARNSLVCGCVLRLWSVTCQLNCKPPCQSRPQVIKLFHSMKFQLLKKKRTFLAFKLSYVVFIMPTIVGILTFMSMINKCSVELSMKKVL